MKIRLFILTFLLFTIFIHADFHLTNKVALKKKTKVFNKEQGNVHLMLIDYASNRFNAVVHTDRSWSAHQFTKAGARPLRMILTNKTKKAIFVSVKSINIPIINTNKVSTNLRGNPVVETIGLAFLGGCFFVPTWIIEMITSSGLVNPFRLRNIPQLPVTSAVNATILVTLGYYFYSANMRDNNIEDEITNIALEKKVIIYPDETLNKIVFIDINYWQPIFNFTVYTENGIDPIQTFNVNLT